MRKSLVTLTVAAGIITGAVGGAALAGGHEKHPAVKARQASMQLYAHYLGQLGAMAKGKVEYNAEKADTVAKSLNAVVGLDKSAMWPQGTSNADLPGQTSALPEIWSTYPAVAEKGKALADASAQMASAAGQGLDSLRGAIGGVGAACGACHKAFRAPAN
ncbi:MAG: c-type cytochrome [Pikeienuella sp.]